MNIHNNTEINNFVNLNESGKVPFEPKPEKQINTNLEEIVLKTKSKQFTFDCGLIMGKIDVPINNLFGLNYHFKKAIDLYEFIESVRSYIATSNNILSDFDIESLTKQYNKYYQKAIK